MVVLDKKIKVALLLAILVLGIYLRLQLFQGSAPNSLFEPDNYQYLNEAKAILSHNLTIPPTNPLSGFPTHFAYAEAPGLGYLQVIIYLITFEAFSLYQVMLALPLIFGIAGMLLAYFITKKLTKNPYVPLLAMFFFAVIPTAVWRTSTGEFRGDSFVPIIAMLPLLFLPIKNKKEGILFGISLIATIVACLLMWNGGQYVPVAIALAIGIFIYFIFISPLLEKKYAWLGKVVLLILCIAFILLSLKPIYNELNKANGIFNNTVYETSPTTLTYLGSEYGGLVFFLAVFYFGASLLLKDRIKNIPIYAYVLAFFIVCLSFQIWQMRWSYILALPACIFGALGAYEILIIIKKGDRIFFYGAVIAVVGIVLVTSILNIGLATKTADYQTPAMMQTLAWIRNNTPQNSTFLSLWPDGSLIEGIAYRDAYSDSMAAAGMGYQEFPDFLYARLGNLSYIEQVRPDYVWIRKCLLLENSSVKQMGNLSTNTSLNLTNFLSLEEGTNITATDLKVSLMYIYNNSDGYLYKVEWK